VPSTARDRRSAATRFALLCALSVIAGWHSLLAAFALALRAGEYTHLLLIAPICMALVFVERTAFRVGFEPNLGIGSALLLCATVIGTYSWVSSTHSDEQLSLAMLAIVTWWIGSFVLSYGSGLARRFVFPLCFLFWLVPIPGAALEKIVAIWQKGSAISASLLFSGVGVPVTQDGIMLSIPGLSLQVAQECSSLRSSLMLIVTSMVLAHLFLRSFWRKAVVILIAIPLSIFKNGIRIFTISMLGTRIDPGFLHGKLHHSGGIVFFALALVAVCLLIWGFNNGEKDSPTKAAVDREFQNVSQV
jgi:exosortase